MPLILTSTRWVTFLPTMRIWNGILECLGTALRASTMLQVGLNLAGERVTLSGLQTILTTFLQYSTSVKGRLRTPCLALKLIFRVSIKKPCTHLTGALESSMPFTLLQMALHITPQLRNLFQVLHSRSQMELLVQMAHFTLLQAEEDLNLICIV